MYRSSHSQMFFKIGVLKNFVIFTGKHLYWSLFLIKLQETPTQVFFCEYCKILMNTFLCRTPRVVAFGCNIFWISFDIGSSHRRSSIKKSVLENFSNLQENTCARVSFLIKLQAEHLLDRTPPDDSF